MPNAVQLIKQDHKKVANLFDKFQKTKGQDAKRQIADQAMEELEVHALVEEEIFYPAVRKELSDGVLIDEALKEHQAVKDLIEELRGMEADDEEFSERWSEFVENVTNPRRRRGERDLAASRGKPIGYGRVWRSNDGAQRKSNRRTRRQLHVAY